MLDHSIAVGALVDTKPHKLPTRSLLPLRARDLCLEIGGRRVIDGMDLTLMHGTLTVVLGPNGAGKSLLLSLLHGLREPTRGTVVWGEEPAGEPTRRRQAMVFQRSVVLRRSVAANIDFVLGLRGAADTRRRDALLERVDLLPLAKHPARLLSGGEQQRLALARALVLEPEVLFLDEPTASLDPASTAMIEQVVTEAHRDGTKVIFVTHDLGQAKRLAEEVVFLHRGRLVEHASADDFFKEPRSPAARAFLNGQIVL